MRQVWMTRTGPPETLELRQAPDPSPGPGEARIRVKAAGINFAEIMARLGLYRDAPKLPAVLGYEVSGQVDAVGEGVTSCAVGDDVVGLCRFGGYSDVVALPQAQIFPLPKNSSYAEGAALPINYLTAYQMLFAMSGVKAGDVVLVHAAAGGVGLAAIDLCTIAGAEVIGTASAAKHAFLRERGIDKVIDYRTEDFEVETLRLTGGRGVQIILDAVGGSSWAKGFRCLAPAGRLVVFGFSAAAQGKKPSLLAALRAMASVPWLKFNPLWLMNQNKGVIGVNLGHLWEEQELVRGWMEQIIAWCEEGKIHPTIGREFKLEDAPAAHHYIQERKNVGKIVLVP